MNHARLDNSRRHRGLRFLRKVHRPALLYAGETVVTLTNSLTRQNPFGDRIRAFPFDFDQPDRIAEHLQGVAVLYNTYWVRFNHRLFKHADAVRNTLALFRAAKQAGVQRIIHVSITNPSLDSPLEYFRGKAVLEKALAESGISYCILRPAVLFGKEDILINNIAWALRRLPVFGVFGDGTLPLAADLRRRPRRAGNPAGQKPRKRHDQRHRAGDVHLPRACGGHWPDHRQAAADRLRPAVARLRGRADARRTHSWATW